MRHLSLAVALFAFWLALSGHTSLFLIAIGALCAAICAWLAGRMGMLDREGHPIWLLPGTLTYYPWLTWEIVKSGLTVSKIILHPKLPISPTMTEIKARQTTSVGIATFANSITLTPGTLTTTVRGDHLTVHALTLEGAIDLEGGVMNERVRRFEGGM